MTSTLSGLVQPGSEIKAGGGYRSRRQSRCALLLFPIGEEQGRRRCPSVPCFLSDKILAHVLESAASGRLMKRCPIGDIADTRSAPILVGDGYRSDVDAVVWPSGSNGTGRTYAQTRVGAW